MARNGESPVIGIHLGTTNSCVGVWKNDRVEIIADDKGNRTTPCYVAFTDTKILVGDEAENQLAANLANTVFGAIRLIGRRFSDASVQSDIQPLPYKVVDDGSGKPMIRVIYRGEQRLFTVEEILSKVLIKLKEIAEAYLNGARVKNAVIAFPAYMDYSQCQAIEVVGDLAGLNVMRIIKGPTAAALAYRLDKKVTKNSVLIFHLGGATFDVSLLTIDEQGSIEVKAGAGQVYLGGKNFDKSLVKFCVDKFNKNHGKDISAKYNSAYWSLRTNCEEMKRTLSYKTGTYFDINPLFQDKDFHLDMNREKFEELNMNCFREFKKKVDECLKDAKTDKSRVRYIVLSGGSTKIPKVQQLLREFFEGKELCSDINPDEVAAHGATVQAAILSRESNIVHNGRRPGEGIHPSNIAQTQINFCDRDHEFELKNYKNPYWCNGCKQYGFGSVHRCKICDFKLHESCMFTSSTTTHEFFKEDIFTFHKQPPTILEKRRGNLGKCEIHCNACGMRIYGYGYHCERKGLWLALHPYCLNFKNEIDICYEKSQRVKFRLSEKVSSKCIWCNHRKLEGGNQSLSYTSEDKKYHFHVNCVMQVMIESWKIGTTSDDCQALNNLKLRIQDMNKQNGDGKGARVFWNVVKVFLETFVGILRWHPTTVLSIVKLLLSLGVL